MVLRATVRYVQVPRLHALARTVTLVTFAPALSPAATSTVSVQRPERHAGLPVGIARTAPITGLAAGAGSGAGGVTATGAGAGSGGGAGVAGAGVAGTAT